MQHQVGRFKRIKCKHGFGARFETVKNENYLPGLYFFKYESYVQFYLCYVCIGILERYAEHIFNNRPFDSLYDAKYGARKSESPYWIFKNRSCLHISYFMCCMMFLQYESGTWAKVDVLLILVIPILTYFDLFFHFQNEISEAKFCFAFFVYTANCASET